jgi:hypothetical protein
MLTTTTKQPPNRDHQNTGPVPASAGEHPVHEGHGRRLLRAFQALEAFPALVEHRDRLIAVADDCNVRTAEIATIVESDAALTTPRQARGYRRRRSRATRSLCGAAARRAGAHLRLLRAQRHLGLDAKILPPSRARNPAGRRSDRRRDRVRAPRPPRARKPHTRHRQARPHARLPRLSSPRQELDISPSTIRSHLHNAYKSSAPSTAPKQSSLLQEQAGCNKRIQRSCYIELLCYSVTGVPGFLHGSTFGRKGSKVAIFSRCQQRSEK